jgi:hypothetical protein
VVEFVLGSSGTTPQREMVSAAVRGEEEVTWVEMEDTMALG